MSGSGFPSRVRALLFAAPPSWRADSVALALLAAVTATFIAPMFAGLDNLPENRDLAKFVDQMALYRITVGDFRQFPLRTHLVGGGYPIIGHPYDPTFHPLALLSLALGESFVVRLNLLLLLQAGALATYGIARRTLGLGLAGSLAAGLAFALCGWAPEQINNGNLGKMYALLFPALLYACHRAPGRPRWIFVGAAAWFIVLTNGAIVCAPMFVVVVLYVLLTTLADRSGPWLRLLARRAGIAALVLGLGTAMAVGKLVPLADIYVNRVEPIHHDLEEDFARVAEAIQAPTLGELARSVVDTPWLRGQDWDLSLFLGWGGAFLCIVGLLRRPGRFWPHAVLLAFLVLVTLGPRGSGPLYEALWRVVPGFRYIFKVAKFTLPYIAFLLALLLGGALVGSVPGRGKLAAAIPWAMSALALASLFQAFVANQWFFRDNFNIPLPRVVEVPEFYQVYFRGFEMRNLDFRSTKKAYVSKQEYLLHIHHKGSINWTTNLVLPERPTPRFFMDASNTKRYVPRAGTEGEPNPGYRGEAYLAGGKGTARLVEMTPLRIRVEVDALEHETLVVNQNFDPAWRSDGGRVREVDGLLGVPVSPGPRTITFRYVPVGQILALLASAAVILLSALYFLWWRPRHTT